MNKIYKALEKILPESQVQEVASAIKEMLNEEVSKIKAEYNKNISEAYESIQQELTVAESTAEEGYKQAYGIINDLMVRLESVQEEWENAMEEGYEQAYAMLQNEQSKNESLEVDLYEQYENKLKQMRDFMVDKIDQFLQLQNAEIYEHARRDILDDPSMVEHKIALDKIVEVASQYISEDEFAGATSSRLNQAEKAVEDLKGHMRVLEARNVRLSTHNTKLTEQVREMNNVLSESTRNERNERQRTAKNASGRGNKSLGRGEQILAEYNANVPASRSETKQLNEDFTIDNDMLILSGVQQID